MRGRALARARLWTAEGAASLDALSVLWHQMPKGQGGQFGADVAVAPDGAVWMIEDANPGGLFRVTPK